MIGFRFSEFEEEKKDESPFERLLKIFLELMTHTSGDFEESMAWLKELDDQYGLTTPEYTLEDFRKELEEKRYVKKDENNQTTLSEKSEQLIRKKALDQIFGKLKKGSKGNHKTKSIGQGGESNSDRRSFQFGEDRKSVV